MRFEGSNTSKATQEESAELAEMQSTKKQTLMSNEVQKLAELEHRHAEEIGLFEAAQDETSAKLEADFSTQLDAHAEVYNDPVTSGIGIGNADV
jgi:hypothetical protein